MEVVIPRDTRVTHDSRELDAHLSSRGGRFAGVLLQQIDPQGPDGFGKQLMFVQKFPEQCTAVRCRTFEWEWDAFGEADHIDFPAGRYLISILADGAAETSAALTFEGLEGSAFFLAMRTASLTGAVLADRSELGASDHVIEGGADGVLDGPGFTLSLGWELTDLGSSGDIDMCWGRPGDRTMFDEGGICRSDRQNSGYTWCCSVGIRSVYVGFWCGLDQVRCQPGPVRLAFRDTTTSVATAAGALGIWVTFGLDGDTG